MDPSFGRFDASHLDACQRVVEFLDLRTHLLHAAREADLAAVIDDLADGRDNGCRAAEPGLFELRKLFSERRVMEGRMEGEPTVMNLLPLMKMMFAPPVSSTLVLVAESGYRFSL